MRTMLNVGHFDRNGIKDILRLKFNWICLQDRLTYEIDVPPARMDWPDIRPDDHGGLCHRLGRGLQA